ncbi:hypothetical protein [Ruminococcus sp.]|uniref:hypothetical protein n=1 Tax=Ruminococcus sp. TaxID=41978 RepID=UPI0025F7F196|nr:hypothetical protein [Ruminococcus sp.]MCR4638962.1 hypothetical protein [Ruminococcus sp.]
MKRYILALTAVCCAVLSSCSADKFNEKKEKVLHDYLLSDNKQYEEYLSMKDMYDDDIDESGYYIDNEINQSDLESRQGELHVSFASNSLLNVKYYSDTEHNSVINEDNCYMNPGDTIYAQIDTTSLVQSNTYEFRGFRMAVFDGEQAIYNYTYFEGDTVTIPKDIQYKEISIIPDGSYKTRNLTFNAEYKDADGNTLSISPVWIINVGNQSYSTKSDNYSVEANATFRVKAQYDPDEYYLIEDEAEPKCETYSDETGIVTFTQYNAQSAIDKYKLVFGKKFRIKIDSISSTKPVTIWIDGKKYEPDYPFKPFEASAKLGAEVRIESEGQITDIGTTKNLFRLTNNGYVYSVYNESDIFVFDPAAYTYSNGKVSFYDSSHKQISKKTNLNIGDVIYYIGQADDGYMFNMGVDERKLTIDSNIEYMLQNELKFMPKQTIDLPQPDKGGTITYFINGKEVNKNNSYFAAGTDKLTASFTPAERYKVNNLSDQAECIVSSTDHRIRFKDNDGNEVTIDKVFELSSAQKASLSVELDESVGTEIKFNIYNGDVLTNPDKKSYKSKEAFNSWSNPLGLDDNELLDEYKIETVSGIKINVSDWSPLKNEAIKIAVTKTTASKKEIKEVYYILSGSGSQSINTDSGDSTYYKDIDIEISKVKGSFFNSQDYTYDNGKVVISYNDVTNKETIKDGEYVDNSREVKITVTANDNYKLYKKNWKKLNPFRSIYDIETSKYSSTCSYKDIDEELSDIKSDTRIK